MNDNRENKSLVAHFHLPGLFEFYELYKVFIPIYYSHREFFYDYACIESIYGAPADCLWGGGRVGYGDNNVSDVLNLLIKYKISGRLTFSNSLLQEKHLKDSKCNKLCKAFAAVSGCTNGVIVHSELLLDYIRINYPDLYTVSSTTKVLTAFDDFYNEVKREEFDYVVPDFRLNKELDKLNTLSDTEKKKVEFLCNECCYIGCADRKACYENVSRLSLGDDTDEHICKAPGGGEGYMFSRAMKNPSFIGVEDIVNIYLPNGFSNFKIEGRSLGSAVVFEMLLYYLVKPEYQINVREQVYLDSMLDLF